jgi:hypothetical protein
MSSTETAGNFTLIENRKTFFFEPTTNDWARGHGCTHDVLLRNGEVRLSMRLLKTVAYLAIDEGADGQPVWEKWLIRDLRTWEHKR